MKGTRPIARRPRARGHRLLARAHRRHQPVRQDLRYLQLALSNAGLWAIGRLQTDADRARVMEGLGGGDDDLSASELGAIAKKLAQRWFLLRNARAKSGTVLLQSRWSLSWMRGPMTRSEVRKARELHDPSSTTPR